MKKIQNFCGDARNELASPVILGFLMFFPAQDDVKNKALFHSMVTHLCICPMDMCILCICLQALYGIQIIMVFLMFLPWEQEVLDVDNGGVFHYMRDLSMYLSPWMRAFFVFVYRDVCILCIRSLYLFM